MTNFGALKSQAELLLAKLEQGKHYVIGDLNERLQKAAGDHPQDIVIKSVASVIERVCSKDPRALISQGDVDKLYNELVGLNASGTRFREVLGDLLVSDLPGQVDVTNTKYINGLRDDPTQDAIDYGVDHEVKSGFDQLFEAASDKYDPQLAASAKQRVEHELQTLGVVNPRTRIAGGNSRFLVFAADLDTNRGAVRVYIPTESTGTKFPSIFVAGNRFETLTATNLGAYLEEAAMRQDCLPNVSAVLQSLDLAIKADKQSVSDENFSKLASTLPQDNGSEGVSGPGLFANLPDQKDDMRDVEIPIAPIPKELKVVASDLEESVMEAAVGYPQATVRLAKRMIIAELGSMGFKGSQIRVASATHDGFICEAILNTPQGKFSIEVPIEMNGNAPLLPAVFAKGDYVAKFDAASIHAIAMRDAGTIDVAVCRDSALHSMNLSELKNTMVRSASENDFDTCDEALEVIANRFDEDTYRTVVADYHAMLAGLKKSGESLKQSFDDADQFVQSPNSIYPIHKQFGLPAHALVRDANGVYHRKSTYKTTDDPDGAFFSTAKVLVGD